MRARLDMCLQRELLQPLAKRALLGLLRSLTDQLIIFEVPQDQHSLTLHLLPALQRATKYKKIMLGRKLLR